MIVLLAPSVRHLQVDQRPELLPPMRIPIIQIVLYYRAWNARLDRLRRLDVEDLVLRPPIPRSPSNVCNRKNTDLIGVSLINDGVRKPLNEHPSPRLTERCASIRVPTYQNYCALDGINKRGPETTESSLIVRRSLAKLGPSLGMERISNHARR